jgi:hypothetical protein
MIDRRRTVTTQAAPLTALLLFGEQRSGIVQAWGGSITVIPECEGRTVKWLNPIFSLECKVHKQ